MIGDGPVKHTMEISEISLNKPPGGVRLLAILDKHRDLFLAKVVKPVFYKIGSIIETFAWNDDSDLLIAIMDSKLIIWYYPSAIFVDQDIAPLARFEKDGSIYGSNAQIVSFSGTNCTLRREDGAQVQVPSISPYASILQEYGKKKQWEQALKLCRHIKLKELWAALAAMSMNMQELNTAEVAYAALDEVIPVL
jgi:intraflagellar transport protein 80